MPTETKIANEMRNSVPKHLKVLIVDGRWNDAVSDVSEGESYGSKTLKAGCDEFSLISVPKWVECQSDEPPRRVMQECSHIRRKTLWGVKALP
jgi:hypothetical protein